jgi:spermidine synthase
MNLWYTEQEAELIKLSFRTEKVLFSGQSEFQKIDVVETVPYGRLLTLDGCTMVSDHDEFVYHEMISHIPALIHKNPKRVLVIGGGDGGTVTELTKHPGIEEIILCEIDGMVVDLCKQYFPNVARGLNDKRVKVNIGDGIAFIKKMKSELDIVVVDSTDPIGPGEGLFSRDFYKSVAAALKPDGLMVAQSESPWFSKEILGRIQNNILGGFTHKKSYVGAIPTYPRGLWSWTVAANVPFDPREFDRTRFNKVKTGLKYLTEGGITAAFEIPVFFREKICQLEG